ncbi:MAG: anthranilate phosphoribosyltransferase [Methanotrichaceae archaeon]
MKYLQQIVEGKDLSVQQAEDLLGKIFNEASDAQIGALLIALKMKGESVSEIAGMAKAMRNSATRIAPDVEGPLVDTCGTGGDAANTINVSTAAAIVTASCGVPVAKHGNYAVSSNCGSANVLSELGVNVTLGPDKVNEAIKTLGIGFMLAPVFHPAMKRVAMVRKDIGMKTVFNVLGPLTNPAGANAQVIGVYEAPLCEKLAEVLKILGTERAMVVHGSGLDEITNTGETLVSELSHGAVKTYSLMPEDFGYPIATLDQIKGGSPHENACQLIQILKGARNPGRDIVCMNSGAALYISDKSDSPSDGARMAEESIDSGHALQTLKKLVKTNGDSGKLGWLL